MRLKLKGLKLSAGRPIIFIHAKDAKTMNVNVGDRVLVSDSRYKVIGRADLLQNFLKPGEFAVSDDVLDYLKVRPGHILDVNLVSKPNSSVFITKKMNGRTLTREEIYAIIKDIVDNALSEAEIAQFVVGVYKNGMSNKETIWLTEAMFKTGTALKWHHKIIADKHSVGGIPGNRTTPIVVAICAAAGVIMPKTSSRAITSAAGTADTIETITKVDLSPGELKKVVNKVGACLAWGGSLGLAPADDKLIKIERILKLDSDSQLLASILSKKLAVGSTHVLIDIPYGEGAKVSRKRAEELKRRFFSLGKHFGLTMKVILTNADQPIGNGIGPTLEMIDVLRVLRREKSPQDLERKSVHVAGIILELVGKARKGEGVKMAQEILDSGKAYKKFKQIIEAQGKVHYNLKAGKFIKIIRAEVDGKINRIDSRLINNAATILGCPADKAAGIYLYKHKSDPVRIGEKIAVLYAESKDKLEEGADFFEKSKPIIVYR